MFIASRRAIISTCNAEALMIPAIVPVPIKRIDTPITLLSPNSVNSTVFFALPVTTIVTKPPRGSAINGSTLIPAIERRARRAITTIGPSMALKKERDTPLVPASSIPSNSCAPPFLASNPERIMATNSATKAGIKFFTINAVRSIPNASDAAIVFGFGEMMFPALPPPIIASKIPALERFAFFAMAMAIGATVITAISMKTPTAQIIIVAIAIAAIARFWPSFFTIVSAIVSAEPVLINAPAKIPLVMIRRTGDIML